MRRIMRRWTMAAGATGLALLLALAGCYATAGYAEPVDEDYYDDVPPPAFIATAPIYYYDGRPAYWYHDHWHFREGGHWHHFRSEPPPLRDYRMGGGRAGPRPYVAPARPVPMERGQPVPQAAPLPPQPPHGFGGRPAPRMRTYERPGGLHR